MSHNQITRCPYCGHKLDVPIPCHNQQAQCPHCHSLFRAGNAVIAGLNLTAGIIGLALAALLLWMGLKLL